MRWRYPKIVEERNILANCVNIVSKLQFYEKPLCDNVTTIMHCQSLKLFYFSEA
jgi:hypothetical protein